MATTTYGSPYVQSSDLVSGWPAASLNVADRIDDVAMKGNGINAQTGTTYTLVLTDAGKNITRSNGSASTLDIPTNASVAFETGTVVGVTNLGSGAVTIQGSGVTINGTSLVLNQYEAASLMKTATDTWVVVKGGGVPKASVSSTTGSPTTGANGSKTYYKWTSSGSVTIPSPGGTFDCLIIGGGGGGGSFSGGGAGGGGGGFNYIQGAYLPGGTYTVTVGGGGAANPTDVGDQGASSALGPFASPGGGGAGGTGKGSGMAGGSGGGGLGGGGGGAGLPGFGNNGSSSGGGGGAGAAATTGTGGAGLANSITGASVTYAAGGNSTGSAAGGANTGNGGGGVTNGTGGAGGSGVVIMLVG